MFFRVAALTRFLIRDFFRSLVGLTPVAILLLVYQAGFYFGGDQQYLMAVGGAGLLLVCLVTMLLFCRQVDRAQSYPLLVRLPWRGELLLAVMASAYLVTSLYAFGFAVLLISADKVTPVTPAILAVVVRWLILFLLFCAVALHISALVSRGRSYIIGLGVLAIFITGLTPSLNSTGAADIFSPTRWAQWITWPISTLLTGALESTDWLRLAIATVLTLLYTTLLVILALRFFQGKDLIWSE